MTQEFSGLLCLSTRQRVSFAKVPARHDTTNSVARDDTGQQEKYGGIRARAKREVLEGQGKGGWLGGENWAIRHKIQSKI